MSLPFRISRWLSFAIVCGGVVALLFSANARSDEFVGPPEKLPAPDEKNVFDKPREFVAAKVVEYMGSIDRFFGDDRNYQETNDSMLQLDLSRVAGYEDYHQLQLSGRARVSLPILERRLHLLVESDPDKNPAVDPARNRAPQIKPATTPKSFAAALRYEKKQFEHWHLSTDGGLKFQGIKATPFARARASVDVPMEVWRMKAAQSLFWFNTIGLGESTQLDIERQISEPMLLRTTSTATWLKETQNVDLRQDISLFHKLDDRSVILYQASVTGVSRPTVKVSEYVLLLLYRYRVHRDWVFMEIGPQIHFPESRNFRPSPVLSMRLELLFEETK